MPATMDNKLLFEDLYLPRREFVRKLREDMSAIVEICWAKDI